MANLSTNITDAFLLHVGNIDVSLESVVWTEVFATLITLDPEYKTMRERL